MASDVVEPASTGRRWRGPEVTVTLLALLSFGGLLLAQHVKHLPAPVQRVVVAPARFNPRQVGAFGREQLSFQLTKRDVVSVGIVNESGETVAALLQRVAWPAYLRLCLAWNGRRGVAHPLYRAGQLVTKPLGRCSEAPLLVGPNGRYAAPGEYRLKVELRRAGRALVLPQTFTLTEKGR